jgi:hypothetical protein
MPLNQDKSGASLKQVIDRSYKRIKGDAACGHDINGAKNAQDEVQERRRQAVPRPG